MQGPQEQAETPDEAEADIFDEIGDEVAALAEMMGPEQLLQALQRVRSQLSQDEEAPAAPAPGPGGGGGQPMPADPMSLALMGARR